MTDKINVQQAVAYGIGGWFARGLRTGDYGRPSLNGFVLAAANDLIFQYSFEKSQAATGKNKQLIQLATGAISTWLIDKLLVPESQKQIKAQEAVLDSIVGNKLGDALIETLEEGGALQGQ